MENFCRRPGAGVRATRPTRLILTARLRLVVGLGLVLGLLSIGLGLRLDLA